MEFNCSSFSTVKNGLREMAGFKWENPDRFVWVDFAQVVGVTVESEATS